jgi:hypothetical protein
MMTGGCDRAVYNVHRAFARKQNTPVGTLAQINPKQGKKRTSAKVVCNVDALFTPLAKGGARPTEGIRPSAEEPDPAKLIAPSHAFG